MQGNKYFVESVFQFLKTSRLEGKILFNRTGGTLLNHLVQNVHHTIMQNFSIEVIKDRNEHTICCVELR